MLYRVGMFMILSLAILLGTPLVADDAPAEPSNPATTQFTPPEPGEPVFPLTIENPYQNNEKFAIEFFKMLATLAFLISLIFIFAWFFKRLMNARVEQANALSSIKILERRNLSPKTLLYVLEVQDKKILIAESHNGVTHLADLPTTSDGSSTSSPQPTSFSRLLERQ